MPDTTQRRIGAGSHAKLGATLGASDLYDGADILGWRSTASRDIIDMSGPNDANKVKQFGQLDRKGHIDQMVVTFDQYEQIIADPVAYLVLYPGQKVGTVPGSTAPVESGLAILANVEIVSMGTEKLTIGADYEFTGAQQFPT